MRRTLLYVSLAIILLAYGFMLTPPRPGVAGLAGFARPMWVSR